MRQIKKRKPRRTTRPKIRSGKKRHCSQERRDLIKIRLSTRERQKRRDVPCVQPIGRQSNQSTKKDKINSNEGGGSSSKIAERKHRKKLQSKEKRDGPWKAKTGRKRRVGRYTVLILTCEIQPQGFGRTLETQLELCPGHPRMKAQAQYALKITPKSNTNPSIQ